MTRSGLYVMVLSLFLNSSLFSHEKSGQITDPIPEKKMINTSGTGRIIALTLLSGKNELFSLPENIIFNRELRNHLVELYARVEIGRISEEKDRQLNKYQRTENENRLQKRYLIIIFILLIVLGSLIFFYIRSKIRLNHKLKAVNTDLSVKKKRLAETLEDLSRSKIKYKTLVEYSPTGILYIDPKGNILEVNQKMLDILGSPHEEATKEINCLNYEPLRQIGLSAEIEQCLASGNRIFNENSYISKWGKQVFLRYFITPVKDAVGNINSLILTVEDITLSKVAEESLKESEVKYRMLVENSLQVIFIIQDGKIIFTNPRFEEVTQYSEEEMTRAGRSWLKMLVFPDDYKPAVRNVKNALRGDVFNPRTEYRYKKKDGTFSLDRNSGLCC